MDPPGYGDSPGKEISKLCARRVRANAKGRGRGRLLLLQIEEFVHVPVEFFLSAGVVEGKAQLVDDLCTHADPFAPAVSANVLLDAEALGVAEGWMGHLRLDL